MTTRNRFVVGALTLLLAAGLAAAPIAAHADWEWYHDWYGWHRVWVPDGDDYDYL